MKDKQYILNEIRQIAAQNGGKPVGIDRFRTETGIASHECLGVHRVRWSDAVLEAGFKPLEFGNGLTEEEVLEVLANLVRQHGRYPTNVEISFGKRSNDKIPAPKTFRRSLGSRAEAIAKVRNFCISRAEYSDVSAILEKEATHRKTREDDREAGVPTGRQDASGYVYLVRSGKLYKIGCSENHWRRKGELHKQTAEGITEIHTIAAIDDAPGIEKYWHEHFKERRQHGEWFDLSAEDISAFKKRKFM